MRDKYWVYERQLINDSSHAYIPKKWIPCIQDEGLRIAASGTGSNNIAISRIIALIIFNFKHREQAGAGFWLLLLDNFYSHLTYGFLDFPREIWLYYTTFLRIQNMFYSRRIDRRSNNLGTFKGRLLISMLFSEAVNLDKSGFL